MPGATQQYPRLHRVALMRSLFSDGAKCQKGLRNEANQLIMPRWRLDVATELEQEDS